MADTRSHDSTVRTALLLLGVLVGAPVLLMLFTLPMVGAYGGMMGGYGGMGGMGGYGGMMGGYGGTMGGYSPLWGIGGLLVPLIVLAVVAYVAYRVFGHRHADTSSDPALDELRLAYARGELTDEEYETRRKNLSEPTGDDRE